MATSKSLRKDPATACGSQYGQRGLTLIETMVAMVILTVGLLGSAALMSQMNFSSSQSRYLSNEALLASEKLEDLNHWPVNDPAIAVPTGTTAGSLTADISQTVTVGAVTEMIDYFDEVLISAGNGTIIETVTSTNSSGNIVYTTTTHSPNGQVVVTNSTTAPSGSDLLIFKRRWIIEKDKPVHGARRMTVVVSWLNSTKLPPFQASMVRP
ncbi:MAG TPA: prepilin-type N-terminal cleavage/methylation domain-containing protein [Candidatus Saccharimonadales bacterium]|jgi:prepilin-type N-terminal cleavage/methylation domain-containing protein|nr:prepilin-type N-terminal cleavage/methylation domain-containing protein [Candidatus Saccharimonadales bacterium]